MLRALKSHKNAFSQIKKHFDMIKCLNKESFSECLAALSCVRPRLFCALSNSVIRRKERAREANFTKSEERSNSKDEKIETKKQRRKEAG